MPRRRDLIGSVTATFASLVLLALLPGGDVDIPVGVGLVIELAILARSALRIAGTGAPADARIRRRRPLA